jgi:hypothetical protein
METASSTSEIEKEFRRQGSPNGVFHHPLVVCVDGVLRRASCFQ